MQPFILILILVLETISGSPSAAWALDTGKAPKKTSDTTSCDKDLTGRGVPLTWVERQMLRTQNQSSLVKRLQTAVRQIGLESVALNEEVFKNHNPYYTYVLNNLRVTNQNQTGRCVIFGAGGILRTPMMRSQLLPKDFEFSENYVWFFALLEQSKNFSDRLIHNLSRKLRARELQKIATPHIEEGSFFQFFYEVIQKYGVAPKTAMDETASSVQNETTTGLTHELDLVLSQFSLKFLKAREAVDALKKKSGGSLNGSAYEKIIADLLAEQSLVMEGIWDVLVTHLGEPKDKYKIRLNYEVKEDPKSLVTSRAIQMESLEEEVSPLQLLELSGFTHEEWVNVGHYPRLKFSRRYATPSLLEVTPREGTKPKRNETLNLPMNRLIRLIALTLREGYPVGFSADPFASAEYYQGILHPDLFKTDEVYGGTVKRKELMDSRQNLNYFLFNAGGHFMDIVGLDQPGMKKGELPDPTQPIVKFYVLNSWDKFYGDQGFLHMYMPWAVKYIESINVPKRFLTATELKSFDQPLIILNQDEDYYRESKP